MRSSSRALFVPLVALVVCLPGCGPDKERVVAEKVAERVLAFQKKKKEECREHLLDLAEHKADSILLAEAQAALQDSLARLRPNRPPQPVAVPPIDSLEVRPIFEGLRPANR